MPVVEVSWGNAVEEGLQAGRRGWFIGHFVAPRAGPAATDMVEVKWGVHAVGEIKATEGVNQTATTMSLLVSGRFRFVFPCHGRSVTLARAGLALTASRPIGASQTAPPVERRLGESVRHRIRLAVGSTYD